MKREERTALVRTEFPRCYSSKETLAALNVIDNLIAQKKIPVMIAVFINPGSPGTPTYNFVKAYSDKWHRTLKDSMRSTLYDTVRTVMRIFCVLADVQTPLQHSKRYNSATTGLLSDGICSFNAAWQKPDRFSRVISWIGNYTSIQRKEDTKWIRPKKQRRSFEFLSETTRPNRRAVRAAHQRLPQAVPLFLFPPRLRWDGRSRRRFQPSDDEVRLPAASARMLH